MSSGEFIRKNRYAVMFNVLLFCFFHFSILKIYGFSIFPDEFAYWAYAATAAGYDWSGVISLGSFYAYGYSFFLYPVFLLCKSALTAYRAAIALNFVFIGLAYLVLCKIQTMFLTCERKDRQLYSAIAMFYPALLFYAQMTMAETLLALLYLLLLFLVGKYLETPKDRGIVFIYLVLFFMYLVHMRTIGTFFVCAGVLVFYEARHNRSRKRVLLIIALSVSALFIAYTLQQKITADIYADVGKELYQINTYTGQLEKIAYIFSKEGILPFLAGICGKILYMGIASCGLAYGGIFYFVKKAGRKKTDDNRTGHMKSVGSIFLLLTVLAQIIISTVYNIVPDSYDCITFGRYHDYMMPVLITAGIREILCEIRSRKKYVLITGFLLLLLSAVVAFFANTQELSAAKGYFMVGMSFFEMKEFRPFLFYGIACLIGMSGMCFFEAVFFWYSKTGYRHILFLGIVVQIILTVRLADLYLYPFNELACQDRKVCEKAEELIHDEKYDSYITYIDYNEISAIGLVQFTLRDVAVKVVPEMDGMLYGEINDKSVILLGADDPLQEELERAYDREMISGHFVLLYQEKRQGGQKSE